MTVFDIAMEVLTEHEWVNERGYDFVSISYGHCRCGEGAGKLWFHTQHNEHVAAVFTERFGGVETVLTCSVCLEAVGWVDCPTGGWWAHHEHPEDGHDAQPIGPLALLDGEKQT